MSLDIHNTILNICNYEYDVFFSKLNVVGVGLGYKEVKGVSTCQKAIQVFVTKKISLDCLSEKDKIPSCYKNIPTDVIETGLITDIGLTDRVRPVTGGYNVGPSGINYGGTYGGLVTDGDSFYILSNNHILADNRLAANHPILQPSVAFGGIESRDTIAYLSKYIPIQIATPTSTPENFVDCAMAKVTDLNLISPEITFIGFPKGVTFPVLKSSIQMTGSTTGYSFGQIRTIGATFNVNFSRLGNALFKNLIISDNKVDRGDSGALLLDFDRDLVIGLVFSGNSNICLSCPIQSVLDALGVTIVID